MRLRVVLIVGLALGVVESPLEGQWEMYPGNEPGELWSPFRLANVLPSGQLVIPVYEGWYLNPDGTKTLSWGYFNMNSEETIDIPVGPDNFIEPREFDGVQPTHFMAASTERGRRNRHESLFTVTVPGDYDQDVVWTLRFRGQTIPSPASPTHEAYQMLNLESSTSAPIAPVLRFEANGVEGRGRVGPTAGPLTVSAGEPLPLHASVDLRGRARSRVSWYPHQGPGDVVFSKQEANVEGSGEHEVMTSATFSEPGDYVLRVTVLETLAALVQHCCWTNGYVPVSVTP